MKSLEYVESFGGIDADADALLDQCFQDHDAYQKALQHERFVVVGRKGTGKTAIYRKIVSTREHNVFTFGHTFEDYPWGHHDAQATQSVPEEARYTQSWKYLVLMTAAKILLNQDQSQPWCETVFEDVLKLEKFVLDSYGSRDPDVTQIFQPSKHLRLNPTLSIPGTHLQVGLSLERLPVRDLPVHFQEVNEVVTECVLRCLNPEHDYFICFDQLDLGFTLDDPRYSQRLIGLLLAARDLSARARKVGKKLSVVAFLRDDIYDILSFEDKNKITENYLARIEWDAPGSEWTLKRLMEERFSVVLDIPAKGSWDTVFDETKEMPSRQPKYRHIVDRTFRRPRDIIKFCNRILEVHKARPDAKDKFENDDVHGARDEYSNYLFAELSDEIFKHIPLFRDYMEALKLVGAEQFSYEDFENAYKRRGVLREEGNPRKALESLFRFSVVAYLKSGGGGGGSVYVWQYIDRRARFDERATAFRIHPGFKEVLSVKRGAA